MQRRVLLLGVALLLRTPAFAQSVGDPHLQVQTVVTGLAAPTTMAFIGHDDILVLQKNDGRVRRVIGGVLQATEALDLPVDSWPDRGLLGIAIIPTSSTSRSSTCSTRRRRRTGSFSPPIAWSVTPGTARP